MSISNIDLLTLAQGGTSASGVLQSGAAPTTTTTTTGAPGAAPTGPAPASPTSMLPLIMMVVVVFGGMMIIQTFGARKERKKRDELMRNLKRGDKVLTIGGIVGTIDQVRDDEIVLKVDPNSNAKIAFTRNAIQQVLNVSAAAPSEAAGNNGTVEVKAKGDKVGAGR